MSEQNLTLACAGVRYTLTVFVRVMSVFLFFYLYVLLVCMFVFSTFHCQKGERDGGKVPKLILCMVLKASAVGNRVLFPSGNVEFSFPVAMW